MGLDIVEIVMRCEEAFGIDLEDPKLGHMRTVGDLHELICEQLRLPFGPDAPTPKPNTSVPRVGPLTEEWTRDTVWARLVQVCVDQLQAQPHQVTYKANFVDDLGAD